MFWWQTESVRNINKAEIHLDIFKTSIKDPWHEKFETENELELPTYYVIAY